MIRRYERLISLGNFCLTKYQINRHLCRKYFGLETNSTNLAAVLIKSIPKFQVENINGGNAIFDWTIIENYENLCDLISCGLDYSLVESNLEEAFDHKRNWLGVRDRGAGILWVHLFSHGDDAPDWKSQIRDLNHKVDHLVENFRQCSQMRTAYLVTLTQAQANSSLPRHVFNSLKLFRGKDGVEFSLVVAVSEDGALPHDDENVFFRRFSSAPDTPQYPWLGDANSWDRIFDEFTFSYGEIKQPAG